MGHVERTVMCHSWEGDSHQWPNVGSVSGQWELKAGSRGLGREWFWLSREWFWFGLVLFCFVNMKEKTELGC